MLIACWERCVASLRDLQRSFAAALRDPAVDVAVLPRANLGIYRNNAAINFRAALESSFPVLRRRVGEDYFRQLAHLYRERFPSRSGDLHYVGRDFADFLAGHLRDGDYEWLTDLARLEWLREEALLARELPSMPVGVMSRFAPDELEKLVFEFQPSLRLHASQYPVFSVWLANQAPDAPPVDQSLGAEAGMVRLRADTLEIVRLTPRLHSYLYALAEGATLAEATERAGLDETGLLGALGFVFNEELVTAVRPKVETGQGIG
jgi:hypothetical protein